MRNLLTSCALTPLGVLTFGLLRKLCCGGSFTLQLGQAVWGLPSRTGAPLWLLGLGLPWLRNAESDWLEMLTGSQGTDRWAQPVDGYLPVGGSGDTGMLKEAPHPTPGALAESLSQELESQ